MSDRRHTPRPSLPEGYQYGDAKQRTLEERMAMNVSDFMAVYGLDGLAEISPLTAWREFGYIRPTQSPFTIASGDTITTYRPADHQRDIWRAPHENAAAQLTRRQTVTTDAYLEAGRRLDAASAPFERVQRTGEETI